MLELCVHCTQYMWFLCRTPTVKKDFRQLKFREKMIVRFELKNLKKFQAWLTQFNEILVLYQVSSSYEHILHTTIIENS